MCSSPDSFGDATYRLSDDLMRKSSTADVVNHPPHYTFGGIECIDALKAALGQEQFLGFCRGAAIKYLWRLGHKGEALEQARKAQWYINRLITELESK